MTSIKGSADTLLETAGSLDLAEQLQFHRIIRDQADYMRGLITDLLDVARIETGTLSVDPRSVEVAGLVDEAKNNFLSGGGRIDLNIELPPGLPMVMADQRRIVQVLSNLLSNAATYSPTDSAVLVTAAVEGVHVAISVTDEGRGVTREHLPHLFHKFFRRDGDRGRHDLGGTGLGLAICKGIVEAHGGRIWAESAGPGLGTRFTFTVPVVETPAAHPAEPLAGPTAGEADQSRILLVDDDPQTLRHVREALSAGGFTLTVTGDPDELPRLMGETRPHLVLLDLMLPETDGIELMQAIPQMADVPVISLSIYGQDRIIGRALDAGATDYVVKPFSPVELTARIRAALRKRATIERTEPAENYLLGDLVIDYGLHEVTVAGHPVPLTGIQYQLLQELSVNADRVVTYRELL